MYAWHSQIHHNFMVLIYSGMGFAQCFPTPHVQCLTLPSPASVQLAINSFISILKVAHSCLTLLSHGQRGIALSQRNLLGFWVAIPVELAAILSEIHPFLDPSPPRSIPSEIQRFHTENGFGV